MRLFILLMTWILAPVLYAQNLVPNPSFEEYLECPLSLAGLDQQLVNWVSWSHSPDFYHECNNQGLGTAGVPENALGFQEPISGMGYTGLVTYFANELDLREYMACPLLTSLEIGETYYVVFHISLYYGGSKEFFNCASNHIGLRFFENPSFNNSNNLFVPDNFAHVDYLEVLDNDTDWTRVEAYFTADANYNWVALGNFYDDANTIIQELNPNNECWAIYYIENICISTNEQACESLLNSTTPLNGSGLTLFPNPAQSNLEIVSNTPIEGYQICDISGRIVKEEIGQFMSPFTIQVADLPDGIYLLKVSSEENQITTKFLKR